jgi:hypothetical protein
MLKAWKKKEGIEGMKRAHAEFLHLQRERKPSAESI